MTATSTPSRPEPTRTGAVWVTGLGAFLLLAAAAVFTAMRWDQIPDAAKLAALGLATGACIVAGRGLRATLPATAGALFHLGVLMVPIDVAAVGTRAGFDWAQLLLAEGLVASVTFAWAATAERSVVLRWAFAGAVVALAGGIGATTILPAPLVLVAFAAVAVGARRDALATGWAALAGIAPLLTFVEHVAFTGAGTVERLGLTGEQPRLAAVLTGLGAAVVLGIVGRRRDDIGLVLLGAAMAAVGIAASWTGTSADASETVVGIASLFLAIELVAHAVRHDPFWHRPSAMVAAPAEWVAALGAVVAGLVVVFAAADDGTDPGVALAALVLGVGWLVADLRRGDERVALPMLAGSASFAGAVALATADDRILAVALVAIAVLATVAQRPGHTRVAVAACIWAPVVAMGSPLVCAVVGVAGSLLLAEVAVRRADQAVTPGDVEEQRAWILTLAALVPGALAMVSVAGETGQLAAALAGGAVLATLVAAVADRGRVTGDFLLGTVPRMGAVAVLAGAPELTSVETGVVALVVAALSLGDAVRLRDPRVALGASLALPVAIGSLARATDLSLPRTGVALTLAAAVLAGLGALLGPRWTMPVVAAVSIAAGAGLVLASGEPAAFADAVMVTSGILLAASIQAGRLDATLASGVLLTGGIWLRLIEADVVASEPYLLPVAALLFVVGLRARSVGTSSWVAYGPLIALLGGAALAERMAGGAGWHAVVAGSVGVVAVVAGGQRRLAAPLLLGTALLVALAGYETLAITTGLPTWAWLGLGGSVLLAAGVAMERHDANPIETGRRLVDVVDERFS